MEPTAQLLLIIGKSDADASGPVSYTLYKVIILALMIEIENQSSNSQSPVTSSGGNYAHGHDDVNLVKECAGLKEDFARKRETENFIHLFGKMLQQVGRSNSCGADIWKLYAQTERRYYDVL